MSQTAMVSTKDKSASITGDLSSYAQIYLASAKIGDELEVRFGTDKRNPITKIDFDNVIAKLKSLGFTSMGSETYRLAIQNEFLDQRTGRTTISSVRAEINGLASIQKYCRSNKIQPLIENNDVSFVQKVSKQTPNGRLTPVDFNDFQFRLNYKEEKPLRSSFGLVKGIVSTWEDSRKIFRLIKRFSFLHTSFPLKVDCSIVRSSTRRGKRLEPAHRIETSGVLTNTETYEIEIEVVNRAYNYDAPTLVQYIRTAIKYVLSGLQGTNFPCSYIEQSDALVSYMKVLYGKKIPERRVNPRDFVGPSSVSLGLANISPLDPDSQLPNVRMPYTVTDKADGIRKLLFISPKGKVYLIDINMRVQFTGVLCATKSLYNTIIDGEHVLRDKNGQFINQYLAFDLYYIGGKDVRGLPFADTGWDWKEEGKTMEFRIELLNQLSREVSWRPAVPTAKIIPMKINVKTFYISHGSNIFNNCAAILKRQSDGLFDYEIDGLIFTPSNKGVASDGIGDPPAPRKQTWKWSMKWKPPEFNSIDFLITTKKTTLGEDFIGNIFESGEDMYTADQLTQYKTLVLRVGFNERTHGHINPCQDIIEDRLPTQQRPEERSRYKPVPFYPTDPTPPFPAYLANILLQDQYGEKAMRTEEGETIEDETIVEFRYDKNAKQLWRWKPIRVRHDKTADYRKSGKNFGNAYHVAQSVWKSIHNPVTAEMLSTGKGIPDDLAGSDIYYNRVSGDTITQQLRNFHNLYVKRALILGASSRGGTLIDMSVGKAGDLPKWIAAKLSFIFGLDVARDNIENRLDGACARFLNARKRFRSMPRALFVAADSSLNIRSGDACFTDKGKEITRAIFGDGAKDETKLGTGVYRQYGRGKGGFDVVSNQFSIHYFFKNRNTLNGFLRNLSECCKVGGYVVGTSYDGRKVFRELETKANGEGIFIMEKEKKMWEIRKRYDADVFENNASCIGYQIDVYQESINKVFPEYLVNYEYLVRLMEAYGFNILSKKEAKELGLPNGIGGFSELFVKMEEQVRSGRLRKSDVGKALLMTPDQKRISFLNKYFIFKKVRDVDAAAVERVQTDESKVEVAEDTTEGKSLAAVLKSTRKKPKIRKIKGKLKLKIKKESTPKTTAPVEVVVVAEEKVTVPTTVVTQPVVTVAPKSLKLKIRRPKGKKIRLKISEKKTTDGGE